MILSKTQADYFSEYWIFPAKHFVTTRENLNRSMNDIRLELSDRLKQLRSDGGLLEAQRLEQRTMYDLEMMAELGYCSGIENYSRHLEGRKEGERPSTLIDYLPDDFLFSLTSASGAGSAALVSSLTSAAGAGSAAG